LRHWKEKAGFSLVSEILNFFPCFGYNSKDFYVLDSRDGVVAPVIDKEK
jgi:hypothetical protein